MSQLGKHIRARRFTFRPEKKVDIFIETAMGDKFKFRATNCSLSGIGASCPNVELPASLIEGQIIPAAKLVAEDFEYPLGRIILRVQIRRDSAWSLGFSLVDTKLPIDSQLSKYIAEAQFGDSSPFDYELSSGKFSMANFVVGAGGSEDIFTKCRQFSVFLEHWRGSFKYGYAKVRDEISGTRVNLERKRANGRSDYIMMGSNDYLGLSSHPRVRAAAAEAINKFGFGATGSPATTGFTVVHRDLELKLAKMFSKDKALLFNSGYTANLGIIDSLAMETDLILADFLCHASIQDALRMARGSTRFFKHNSIDHLAKLLKESRDKFAGCLIITEGVFSMDGDVPDLKKILDLAKQYNCRVMVDEAHSFGVLGKKGLGACEEQDVLDRVDIIMGTFSKIAGGIGGFVTGKRDVVEWIAHFGHAYTFSVASPPSTVAAVDEALKIFESEPQRRGALKHNVEFFCGGLRDLGFEIPADHRAAVIPVLIGDEDKLAIIHETLLEGGIFVIPVTYPGVSRNGARFRFTVTSEHSVADLDLTLSVLERGMLKAGFSPREKRQLSAASSE